jgi:hypothetical protein
VAGAVSTGAGDGKSVSSSSRSWKRFREAKREETALRGVFGGFDVSRRRLCLLVVLMELRGGVEKQKARETWNETKGEDKDTGKRE